MKWVFHIFLVFYCVALNDVEMKNVFLTIFCLSSPTLLAPFALVLGNNTFVNEIAE